MGPGNKSAVASAVIVRARRLLLTRRRQREGSLLWALPGGKIEAGESASEAAVRETAEETALAVAARQVLGERVHPDTNRHMTYVACDVLSGEARVVDGEALDAVEWVPVGNLAEYVPDGFFEPVRRYLREETGPHR